MFELIRFARYASRFERAYKTDDWSKVRRCFADDATYTIVGGVPPTDGTTRGADEIMRFFKRMLDAQDRRFDRRIPKLDGWPRSRGGVVTFKWRARYVLGAESTVLTGVETVRFARGLITELQDVMPHDEVVAMVALAERSPRRSASA